MRYIIKHGETMILKKYKDILFYTIFGVLTTLINIITYWAMSHFLMWNVMISTVFAWFIAVVFAFMTNRKWVFYSSTVAIQDILLELLSFLICRLGTGIIDIGIMFLFVEQMDCPDTLIKTLANIIVIALNYAASKWIIFKSRNK